MEAKGVQTAASNVELIKEKDNNQPLIQFSE
jgi:hypothetical protein